ncbi:AraC family transcriptional regulator [Flavivirga algicola]|uniref:AraC family transcriptional regulator n=1 Tax=Flavivirga algicola TaxID=2729136 RepID=A0ABX1S0K0_9FLAO|nr:AraC family transcriptional regulator [Flavivirga algicola]NMH89357.1 AraC family transcriptional regulator [Flavivirga algicola]
MKVLYKHIPYSFENSFQVEKFDQNAPCVHHGLHYHDSYEIVFIKNGHGKIIIEGNEVNYKDGALVFLGPCIPHFSFSNNMFKDNYEIVIHFGGEFVEQRLKLFPELRDLLPLIQKSKQFLIFDPELKKKLTPRFEKITDLNGIEQLISIFSLLYELSKSTPLKKLIKEDVSNHYAQNKQVKKIFKFINENYQHKVSTKDIATHVGLTTNSFCRMFKVLTQKSFISYLNEYRIHLAMKLLEETDDNISEIVYQCGFENLSYFSKIFLQLKGCRPIEYRKNYRIQHT